MVRIAVVDNEKLKDMERKKHIQSLCPVNRSGQECIYFDGDKLLIDESLCIGCGICANQAPEAISVINLPEELLTKPIHQYGENGFHLYNLPIPIFGKTVGIIGKNGIGKSTAMKVLAGILTPNLGNLDAKQTDWNELIKYFKGTEAQIFFEKLRDNDIKISYKPQQVDLLTQQYKGKVKDLLKKVDEKKQLKKIAKQLEIENILDNELSKISGGELQRVAIAATVLKKANLLIFDELTSYLDIKQRLKISKFIKSLADENTAVLVVEHDLIALDYMTDLIHIMYGKEACYGIVSQPKSTKNGINTYLQGFLKEENMRFRDHEIKFEKRPPIKTHTKNIMTGWRDIEKKLGKFQLKSNEGEVYKKEVIGILGENGIGKTSFVKLLAEVDKPDKGKITEKVKVSYKPQYIDTTSDELVMNVLQDAIKKYTTQLINPLTIKPLLMKPLNELSGGELQRVAIAAALSKDFNLALLDEPSAYLDVEQRLIVSKIIRNFIEEKGRSALVVDHDLLFIDYLSDRLLVFDGIPAEQGTAKGPFPMEDGMNTLLKEVKITLRRDETSGRPRINKPGSVKDRTQKASGKYYYE